MKNIIFFFSFIFSSLILVAQRSPVMPYGVHDYEDIIAFISRGSDTAKVFKKILLYRVSKLLGDGYKPMGENAIPWILKQVSSEEISFEAGEYKNSGWNPKTRDIESFPGKKWEGFVGVFRWEGFELILYKENCLNFLYVETKTAPPAPPPSRDAKEDDLPYDPARETKETVIIKEKIYIPYESVNTGIEVGGFLTSYRTRGSYGYGRRERRSYQNHIFPGKSCDGNWTNTSWIYR